MLAHARGVRVESLEEFVPGVSSALSSAGVHLFVGRPPERVAEPDLAEALPRVRPVALERGVRGDGRSRALGGLDADGGDVGACDPAALVVALIEFDRGDPPGLVLGEPSRATTT